MKNNFTVENYHYKLTSLIEDMGYIILDFDMNWQDSAEYSWYIKLSIQRTDMDLGDYPQRYDGYIFDGKSLVDCLSDAYNYFLLKRR